MKMVSMVGRRHYMTDKNEMIGVDWHHMTAELLTIGLRRYMTEELMMIGLWHFMIEVHMMIGLRRFMMAETFSVGRVVMMQRSLWHHQQLLL